MEELISDILLWTLSHGRAKEGRPARTYIQQLCANTGCSPEDLPEAMDDREGWRKRVREIRADFVTWWWWWWWWWWWFVHREKFRIKRRKKKKKKKREEREKWKNGSNRRLEDRRREGEGERGTVKGRINEGKRRKKQQHAKQRWIADDLMQVTEIK